MKHYFQNLDISIEFTDSKILNELEKTKDENFGYSKIQDLLDPFRFKKEFTIKDLIKMDLMSGRQFVLKEVFKILKTFNFKISENHLFFIYINNEEKVLSFFKLEDKLYKMEILEKESKNVFNPQTLIYIRSRMLTF